MILKKIYNFVILPSCLFFTLITFVMTGFLAGFGYDNFAPTFRALGCYFLYSLFLSLVNLVFRVRSLNLFVKILLHYVGVISGFFVVFTVMMSNTSKLLGAVYLAVAITVVYVIVAVIASIIVVAVKNKNNVEKKYTSQFHG